ncbi:MAG TPA: hypothetical protein DCS07_13640, partial [Bdellovibrionales bacterium]|nr:hypothetical protein [Bdellovibrionales bacterium]
AGIQNQTERSKQILAAEKLASRAPAQIHPAQAPVPKVRPLKKVRPISLPDLSTAEKRVGWLMSVQEKIPGLFKQAATHDVNLLKLLEAQSQLQTELAADPEYLKMLQEAHPGLLEIEIRSRSVHSHQSFRIREDAVAKWKAQLAQRLDQLMQVPGSGDLGKDLAEMQKTLLSNLAGRSSQGMITGIGLTLPSDKREALFRAATSEEKLRILSSNLPDRIGDGFKSEQYLLQKNPSKVDTLKSLREVLASEQRLHDVIEMRVVLQNGEGVLPSDRVTAKRRIAAMAAEDLEFFTDPDALKPRLKGMGISGPSEKNISNLIQKGARKFAEQTEEVSETLSSGIRLVEVPPAAGIFRGCTGGDCSTRMSFPYPNAPAEKVFFIYDHAGLKGYATGTVGKSKGKKSFYLITIAGPRMSGADTKMVFEGLDSAKQALGIEQILLPQSQQVTSMINFLPIREEYQKALAAGESVKFIHIDKQFRKSIQNFESDFNTKGYDHIENNLDAVIYKPDVEMKKNLAVTVSMHPADAISPKPVDKPRLISFILDLIQSGRVDQTQEFLSAVHLTGRDLYDAIYLATEAGNPEMSSAVLNLLGMNDTLERLSELAPETSRKAQADLRLLLAQNQFDEPGHFQITSDRGKAVLAWANFDQEESQIIHANTGGVNRADYLKQREAFLVKYKVPMEKARESKVYRVGELWVKDAFSDANIENTLAILDGDISLREYSRGPLVSRLSSPTTSTEFLDTLKKKTSKETWSFILNTAVGTESLDSKLVPQVLEFYKEYFVQEYVNDIKPALPLLKRVPIEESLYFYNIGDEYGVMAPIHAAIFEKVPLESEDQMVKIASAIRARTNVMHNEAMLFIIHRLNMDGIKNYPKFIRRVLLSGTELELEDVLGKFGRQIALAFPAEVSAALLKRDDKVRFSILQYILAAPEGEKF